MRSHQITSHDKDNYFRAIKQNWNVICHAYLIHEYKKPIMLLDVTTDMVYAYPYKIIKRERHLIRPSRNSFFFTTIHGITCGIM